MLLTHTRSQELEAIYSDHHGWLVNLLRRKLGNIDNANDLAQDTFARILTGRDKDVIREPRAYLTTIASRLTAQYFRRLALERAYLDALAGMPEETAPSPETRILIVEALTAVSRVLDALSPRVRDIFLLSQLDGLTYAEIASQFDMSVNAVQKSMIRAFQHCYAAVYAP
ncbi:sigma-70 family RNA polymerase sigma factor [Herminiimonas fonticola]|uniref:RNA polymerase sigma-70 factor (ECF subfamily) n=1 Tax=Herminiimonas fonticola TaxID=303380 RepID=A0A4R6G530_9BURK|nr:sigma-70 family RNA polymerase sigma factor [Herminiimonas fonticola]RBA23036.1 sigma70-ECF: RNA polymerase sigma factor, sigma-70 family [Herminiimonas fonticola]TDN89522.1 RNA polymerase sigma-70 factor (ECF subfamily) [Herminiimonas fonticola]